MRKGTEAMGRIVVVGSGFSGGILARKIAEELDRPVTVIEKRRHIGGNMYDEYDEHGILIHRYGPHFLNTDDWSVMEFLQQFTALVPRCAKFYSVIDGKYVRLPYNFETVQQLIGPEKAAGLLPKLRKSFPGGGRVPVSALVEHPDEDIRNYGVLLFEKAYRTYTSKMWGLQPEQIDRSVLDRVPMAMNYDERYLNKDFQFLPEKGYTELFKNMLAHPNITVRLGDDALRHIGFSGGEAVYDGEPVECLIYTGPIDELFGCRYGRLPYRSLDIRYEYFDRESMQPSMMVSYPQAAGYTRTTEYRKVMPDDSGVSGTVIATEYPVAYDPESGTGMQPYYPVITEDSGRLYKKYEDLAKRYENLFLCGRLADYKYYNMDACILHTLERFGVVKAYLEGKKR